MKLSSSKQLKDICRRLLVMIPSPTTIVDMIYFQFRTVFPVNWNFISMHGTPKGKQIAHKYESHIMRLLYHSGSTCHCNWDLCCLNFFNIFFQHYLFVVFSTLFFSIIKREKSPVVCVCSESPGAMSTIL